MVSWEEQLDAGTMMQVWDEKFGSGKGTESFEMEQYMVRREELTEILELLGTWGENANAGARLAFVWILFSFLPCHHFQLFHVFNFLSENKCHLHFD